MVVHALAARTETIKVQPDISLGTVRVDSTAGANIRGAALRLQIESSPS
jgi:hypothetical protein